MSLFFLCSPDGIIIAPEHLCNRSSGAVKGIAHFILNNGVTESPRAMDSSVFDVWFSKPSLIVDFWWKYIWDGNLWHTLFTLSLIYYSIHPFLFALLGSDSFEALAEVDDLDMHLAPKTFKIVDLCVRTFKIWGTIFIGVNSAIIYSKLGWETEVDLSFPIASTVMLLFMGIFHLLQQPGHFSQKAAEIRYTDILNSQLQKKLANETDFLSLEESLLLEFKTSFQTTYPDPPQKLTDKSGKSYFTIDGKRRFQSVKEIEKLLQDMVLEAIVGFLNSSGGHLVIGINEKDNNKKIVGIEYENHDSEDVYERNVIQHIINRIGKEFLGDYITTHFQKHGGKTLFIISIKAYIPKKGQIPALLDGTKCYKRTGPRTDVIEEGAEFATFVANRAQ